MMAAVDRHPNLSVRWLQRIYNNVENGWVTVFSQDRTTGERATAWATVNTLETLDDHIRAITPTSCVWFGVATRKTNLGPKRRGGIKDCELVPAMWVDIDIAGPNHSAHNLPATLEDAWNLLHRYPIAPTVVINTGGGLQPWWVLDEPVPATEVEPFLTRWGATWAAYAKDAGVHIDNVFNVDRVMRLPGTTNHKNQPIDVQLIEADWTRVYGIDDLDQYTVDPPTAPAPEPLARLPYIGPSRPGDAFNAVRSGNEILAAAGFHSPEPSGADTNWCRPGKTAREGHSATVYADGHTTIWSDTVTSTCPATQVRRPYDPFGLYTAIFHNGDFTAASDELERQGYGTKSVGEADLAWSTDREPATVADIVAPAGPQPIVWAAFWGREHVGEQWLVHPLLPAGRQVALWAKHKTGKSLLSLEVSAAVATGRAVLDQQAGPPRNVIYIDLEMTEDDLHERLEEMGYGPGDNLDHLHYYLLPSLPPLDSDAGGRAVITLADRHQAELVVIDTMARAVSGDENDADTYRDFYRYTGLHLKARGIAMMRLDHGGKDDAKGQRGSSGKGDDVDVVWQLRHAQNGLILKRDAARMSWVPETVALERVDNPFHHRVVSNLWPPKSKECADTLTRLGVPLDATNTTARAALTQSVDKYRNEVVAAALRWRRVESQHLLTDWAEKHEND